MSQTFRIGILTGLLVAGFFLIDTALPPEQILKHFLRYGGTLLTIAGIYVAIRRTRDIEQNGLITTKEGLKAGMKAGVCIAILFMIAVFVSMNYITSVDYYLNEANPVTKKTFAEVPSILKLLDMSFFLSQSFHFSVPTMMIGFFAAIGSSFVLRRGSGMLNSEESL